ncbi:50S ribosomal protein L30e [Candidatus Bathyarchaeota archaeon]|nr:50S ribosomal protein L30e [Candidatus Bathyarchaeota archaeon]
MVDVNKQIRMAVKTGKVGFGSKDALASSGSARAKLIILARNCRESDRMDILHSAEQSEVPVYTFQGSSLDLGAVCEKPFPVSAIVVREPGDSEVLKLVDEKK